MTEIGELTRRNIVIDPDMNIEDDGKMLSVMLSIEITSLPKMALSFSPMIPSTGSTMRKICAPYLKNFQTFILNFMGKAK